MLKNCARFVVLTALAGALFAGPAQAATVTVTAPVGGEVWVKGSTHNVTWTVTGSIGTVTIDLAYSINGGAFTTFATGIANDLNEAWLVPASQSDHVKVRVTAHDTGGPDASGTSANDFYIVTALPTPAMDGWGLLALALAMGGGGYLMLRRNRLGSET